MPNCEPAAVVTNAGTCLSSKESKRSFFTICACTLPGSNMQTSAAAPIFHLLNCIMAVYLRLSIFATWKSAKEVVTAYSNALVRHKETPLFGKGGA